MVRPTRSLWSCLAASALGFVLAPALCLAQPQPAGDQPDEDPGAVPEPLQGITTDDDGPRHTEGTAPASATTTPARPRPTGGGVHMFSSADDRAEHERLHARNRPRAVRGDPEQLELAGMPDAWFYRPRVGGRRRIFVYLHSRGADPKEACRHFAEVIPQYGWLVCPVGPGSRNATRRVWNNNATVARRYSVAALDALNRQFPRRTFRNDNVIMGFSEGAFVAMQTGLAEPQRFPRWIIFAAHDGYVGMNTELYPVARRALRREYLITGTGDEIVARTRRAAELMRREHLGAVEMRIIPGMVHELPPDFAPTVRRAVTWVTSNVPIRAPRTPAPRTPTPAARAARASR